MASDSVGTEIQRIQTEHRERLVASWDIPVGANVLEVGCGQGDMTEVLARTVGPSGHVTAVDIASPDYGSPLNLGQATDLLKASAIGDRIDFRFNFNVLDPLNEFKSDEFDFIIFAMSSWYFESEAQLKLTLERIQKWGKRLCFAEWDMEPGSPNQFAHLLAVLIQGQVEAFKDHSEANIRTPLTRGQIERLINACGWEVCGESRIQSDDLQDADWEIQECLRSSLKDAKNLSLPDKYLTLLKTQIHLLRELSWPGKNQPLCCFSFVAEREQ